MHVTIDGRSLYVETHGDGEPILFVHGFPLSGEMWAPLVPGLRDRHRLIVPDLAGHGRSDPAPGVTMARFADDLLAALAALGEDRPFTLVGMSMGGYVAFELCRRRPDRVRALVLANTRAQPDAPEVARDRRETAGRVRREGAELVADGMLPKLFGPDAGDDLRERWRAIMAATPAEGAAGALLAMADRPDSFPTLAALTCPVLVVAGEHDAITPPADATRMRDAARSATLETIAGAGHMSAVEEPRAFLDALRRFLAGLPAPR